MRRPECTLPNRRNQNRQEKATSSGKALFLSRKQPPRQPGVRSPLVSQVLDTKGQSNIDKPTLSPFPDRETVSSLVVGNLVLSFF
jgi:hypothetical protein